MIHPREFVACLDRHEISRYPPLTSIRYYFSSDSPVDWRSECTSRGMWALVYKNFAQQLASWIGKRTVLEVMAGRGWLAKALSEYGIDIVATDNHSWDEKHSKMVDVFPIVVMDAIEAAKMSLHEVLIISWPFMDDIAYNTIKAWGKDRPIVYIGEWEGGCTASDLFFSHFVDDYKAPEIRLAQWDGLRDFVYIGHYSEIGDCQKDNDIYQ